MKIGFIGLGKMGNRMVSKLLEEGHEVVVWNRTREKIDDLISENENYKDQIIAAETVSDLISKLEKPKIVWSMLPAGDATSKMLSEISKYVEKEDIVVDGANSYFKDTDTRYEDFKSKGIRFLGVGVSGGIIARTAGYPIMVGGDRSAYDEIKPVLDSLSKPGGGNEYFGEGGAGHFVKMVHNGIEYGYMQAIGEGFGVMEKGPHNLDLVKVAKLYQKGTLVSGFMMERTIESLENDPRLEKLDGQIAATGEGEWTIKQGKEENVPVDVIEKSLEFRRRSTTEENVSNSFAARLVAALRAAFGGHAVKEKS